MVLVARKSVSETVDETVDESEYPEIVEKMRRQMPVATPDLLRTIGHTPLIEIPNRFGSQISIYAKLEYSNPGGSVKDRAAVNIVRTALRDGSLFARSAKKTLIDATSGNTGIAYAMLGASLGFPVELAMPENASAERKLMLQAYHAKLHLTPAGESTDGAQDFVKSLAAESDSYFYPDQYAHPANWQAHYDGTGPEIMQQVKNLGKSLTHFCCGIGTCGTFVGCTRYLRQFGVKAVEFQPDSAMHGLEGWKHLETARVPKIYDASLADDRLAIDTVHGYEYAIASARYLGLLISPSAAANLYGAVQLAAKIKKGVIVTIFPDNASKYLSETFWRENDYIIENPFF